MEFAKLDVTYDMFLIMFTKYLLKENSFRCFARARFKGIGPERSLFSKKENRC